MKRPRAETWVVRVFFLLAFVVFTTVFPYIQSINNPNENVRVFMTMSLVEKHTFVIDDIVARHGWTNDMAKVPDPKGTGESHFFSVKAPAVSYAGVPFYWAFTKIAPRYGHPVPTVTSSAEDKTWWLHSSILVMRLFTIQLPCFLFLVWLERYLRTVSADVVLRLSAVAAAGLGTNYLAYAMMYASHSLFACAAFASFAITTQARARYPQATDRKLSSAFWAGFFAGLATLLEYHALPVSVGLAVYALTTFFRPTRLVMFGVGGMIHALALMFFQKRCFGSPFTPGHKFSETEAFRTILSTGVFGINAPKLEAFQGTTTNVGFGFFGTSPFMWLGLLAIPLVIFFRRPGTDPTGRLRRATIAWTSIMLLLFVTVSAAVNWRAGWAIGPRYLGAAPPFFAFGAVCALEQLAWKGGKKRLVVRSLAGGLAIASVVQSGLVGLLYNTLPEAYTRPLTQFALPMMRTGFVPHHAGELLGYPTATFWYVVAGCMGVAALVAALWRARDRLHLWAVRIALTMGVFALGIRPAMSKPKDDEMICTTGNHCDDLAWGQHFFPSIWEPADRNRLT
ncbi:MAG: hypothetical protein ABI175_28945, partial [Polyangiales bacterium]